jgi:ABC-type uncharacterized transport system permease subunit
MENLEIKARTTPISINLNKLAIFRIFLCFLIAFAFSILMLVMLNESIYRWELRIQSNSKVAEKMEDYGFSLKREVVNKQSAGSFHFSV